MAKEKLPRIKKRTSLDPKELKKFVKFLPPSIKILAETYKFACEAYAEIGLLYYWVEIFRLPATAIYKSECGHLSIALDRSSHYGTQGELGYIHYVPDHLSERLLILSESNQSGLLFRQEDGSAFDNARLEKEFCKASGKAQEAGVITKHITPMDFRSTPPEKIKFLPGAYREVSEEKVQEIEKILPRRRRNAGCPRKHPLKNILEALLAQEDFGYSRSNFKKHFPAIAIAAEKQKRPWMKKIWPRILRILQS